MLSRDQILAYRPKSVEVDVPEWGGKVRLQEMGVTASVALIQVSNDNANAVQAYLDDQELPESERVGVAKVDPYNQLLLRVLYSIVDANGTLMFSVADYPMLESMPLPAMMRLWESTKTLSTDATVEAVEVEKKGFAKTSRKDSHSA